MFPKRYIRVAERLRLYAIAFFFESMSYAVISTFMIPIVKDLGGTDFETLLVHTTYGIGMITAFLWGTLSDILGRKHFITLGYLGSIPILLIGILVTFWHSHETIYAYYVLILLYSMFYAMVYSSFVAEASLESNPSKAFGSASLGMSLGWGIGGLLAGFVGDFFRQGLLIAHIIAMSSHIIFNTIALIMYKSKKQVIRRSYRYKFRYSVLALLVSIMMLQFGIEWVYGLFSIKTYMEILGGSKLYYGIFVIMLPGIVGAFAAPFYAKVSERFGGLITYGLAIAMYSVFLPLLALSSGYIALILWAIPIWPAYDIGSKKSGEELVPKVARGKIVGAITAVMEIAIIISAIGGKLSDMFGRNEAILIGSLVVIASAAPYLLIWKIRKNEPRVG